MVFLTSTGIIAAASGYAKLPRKSDPHPSPSYFLANASHFNLTTLTRRT